MASYNDLPYLIKLIDDESFVVRDEVKRAFLSFGEDLEDEISSLSLRITPLQQLELRKFLVLHRRKQYQKHWHRWMDYGNSLEGLEQALSDLAYLDYGRETSLKEILDELVIEFKEHYERINVFSLMDFLFNEKKLGQPKHDYYNPLNSNLIFTVQSLEGIPISLTAVAMLLGRRADIEIRGVNFPGNFLCRSIVSGTAYFFDCFQSGKILTEEELDSLKSSLPVGYPNVFERIAANHDILLRVIRNLMIAYEKNNDFESVTFFDSVAKEMQRVLESNIERKKNTVE